MTKLERLSAHMVAAKMVGNSLGALASDAVHVKHLERVLEVPFIDEEQNAVSDMMEKSVVAAVKDPNQNAETRSLTAMKVGLRVILDYLERP